MPSLRLFLLVLAVAVCPAWAQERAERGRVAPSVRVALDRGAAALRLPSERAAGLRVDARTGVVRGDYAPPAFRADGPPEEAARRFLSAHAARYGLDSSLDDLRVSGVVEGRYDRHVAFVQTARVGADRLPVAGRRVQVSMAASGDVLLVTSAYEPIGSLPAAGWDDANARARAGALVEGGRVAELERVVMPPAAGRAAQAAYRALVIGGGEWAFVIGLDGAVLFAAQRSLHHGAGHAAPEAFALGDRAPAGRTAARASSDGSGLAFVPDPLTSAGAAYQAPYVDSSDAAVAELDAERVAVALPEITQRGGLWHLEGPYVVVDGTLGAAYTPPAEADPDGFRYSRADDRFEAVMVYHHIDADQRRAQALDVGRPVLAQPVRVNPHGFASDDSRFYPSSFTIRMGVGAVDDAEDAMVIRHEYAHALLQHDAPGLYQADDGTALHEGWADYWAASWRASLIESGQGSGEPRHVFPWDGNAGCWQGRRLDHPGFYDPDDPSRAAYPPPGDGCPSLPTIYQRGVLWATTLFDLREQLGAAVMDRLALASNAFVGQAAGVPAFEAAAQALLAADQALYGGRHRQALAQGLSSRGYVDAAAVGPVLRHTPLRASEQQGGTRTVSARVQPATSTVRAVYRWAGGADRSVTLSPVGAPDTSGFQLVSAELPLPDGPGQVTYALEAEAAGVAVRLPVEGAFAFASGPDTRAPALEHRPPGAFPADAWPPLLSVEATDALGVAGVSVYVAYRSQGETLLERTLPMERAAGPRFEVRLPDLARPARPGDVVDYRFSATDSALAANTSSLPDGGTFSLVLADGGALFAYDFETATTEGFRGDDPWRRVASPDTARSGQGAWHIEAASGGPSALDLPPMSLPAGTWLTFWHRYRIGPGSGARVEVRPGAGGAWTPLTPGLTDWGAPGGPSDGYPSPQGWQGDSQGWQRAAFALPAGDDVRVRLALDPAAPSQWSVDDLAVATEALRDTGPPSALDLPDAPQTREARRLPLLSLRTRDDVGVAAVYAHLESAAGAARFRLDQTTPGPDGAVFAAQLPDSLLAPLGIAPGGPEPGTSVRYGFAIVDVAGNRTQVDDPAFRLDFRTLDCRDALSDAALTGAWRFEGRAARAGAGRADRLVSALLLPPLDLPANADAAALELRHAFDLPAGAAAQVSLSADGGAWAPLVPVGGYPSTYAAPDHPLTDQPVWTGAQPDSAARFDLSAWAGQTVRIRALIAHAGGGGEWRIDGAARLLATPDEGFDGPSALRLDVPTPHPMRGRARVSYAVPGEGRVTLALYDLLGRRVALLVDDEARPAAAHTHDLDVSSLAAGVYLLRLEAGSGSQVRRVVVL